MKYLLFLFLCVVAVSAHAQKASDSVYVSRNGTTFKVGQKVTIGLGTGTDGTFKYIVGISFTGLPDNRDFLPAEYATRVVTIAKIKRQKVIFSKDADITVYLLFKSPNTITSWGINIEPALLAKEVIPN